MLVSPNVSSSLTLQGVSSSVSHPLSHSPSNINKKVPTYGTGPEAAAPLVALAMGAACVLEDATTACELAAPVPCGAAVVPLPYATALELTMAGPAGTDDALATAGTLGVSAPSVETTAVVSVYGVAADSTTLVAVVSPTLFRE